MVVCVSRVVALVLCYPAIIWRREFPSAFASLLRKRFPDRPGRDLWIAEKISRFRTLMWRLCFHEVDMRYPPPAPSRIACPAKWVAVAGGGTIDASRSLVGRRALRSRRVREMRTALVDFYHSYMYDPFFSGRTNSARSGHELTLGLFC